MAWPKPPDDNGIGIHFGHPFKPGHLDRYLPLLKELHIKWVVLALQSEENIGRVALGLLDEGIMPIARPYRAINKPADFADLARACHSPYVQVYNEFGDDREWWYRKPKEWWDYCLGKWIKQAHRVRSAGCYPGLQVTSTLELIAILEYMRAEGEDSLWPDMWLSLHLYPTDDCLPWCHGKEHGVLAWKDYAQAAKEWTGLDMPIIVAEGGWTDGQGTPEDRARWMVEVYEWFRDMAPQNLFAFCPYLLFGKTWFGFSWADNIAHQPMVEAVKAMSEFVRDGPEPKPKESWRVVSEWLGTNDVNWLLSSVKQTFPDIRWEWEEKRD